MHIQSVTLTKSIFFDAGLLPFHFCVVAIFILIIAETIGIYMGYRPSNYFRKLIPNWIKESPLLQVQISRFIILIFFLINLSYAGYFFQLGAYALYQEFLPASVIFIPALIMTWFFTLFMMHCLDQVIRPMPATAYVRLVGRFATIVSGHGRPGFSAQASVRDHLGRLHFVAVEPEFGELELQTQVILIGYVDEHYIAKKITAEHDGTLSTTQIP